MSMPLSTTVTATGDNNIDGLLSGDKFIEGHAILLAIASEKKRVLEPVFFAIAQDLPMSSCYPPNNNTSTGSSTDCPSKFVDSPVSVFCKGDCTIL
jgi:hypothetical protein